MGATSATGVSGFGDSGKATTNKLSIWANGPQILASGIVETDSVGPTSPPSSLAEVSLPIPLPGTEDDYCIMLTTKNGGVAYVVSVTESGGNVTGFSLYSEMDCDVMWIVVPVGFRSVANV